MKISFFVRVSLLKDIQDKVKRYDGRFVHNPLVMGEKARVSISFDESKNFDNFNRMLNVVQQPWY